MIRHKFGTDLEQKLVLIFDIFGGIKTGVMNHNDGDHQQDNKPAEYKTEKQALNSYVKYTGVAFQMMAIIGLSAYIGYKTDQYYEHKTQWVTAIACVLGVFLSIYQTIRQLKS